MITDELIERLKAANTNLLTAQAVLNDKSKVAKDATEEVALATAAVASATREFNGIKAEIANSLNVDPTPVPRPVDPVIIKPRPVTSPNNNTLYIVMAIAAAIWFASYSGLIDIKNPFKPGPTPPPVPAPIVDPIRVSYIYDKDNATQTTREIRNNVEKIESELKAIQAEYRAYDVNDDEVKRNYLDAVTKMNGQLPILIIQNDKTGKQINIVKAPATSDDIINATKNARNGK